MSAPSDRSREACVAWAVTASNCSCFTSRLRAGSRGTKWQRWLETERSRGRIGGYGIAVESARLRTFLEHEDGLLGIAQVPDSLEGREAQPLLERGVPLQITFGYIASAVKAGQTDIVQVLRNAMHRNRKGAIVVSTRRVDRIAIMARALRSPSLKAPP